MKAISRADVAWYILALAEDPSPPPRTPVVTTGARRKPRPAKTRDRAVQQAPSRK